MRSLLKFFKKKSKTHKNKEDDNKEDDNKEEDNKEDNKEEDNKEKRILIIDDSSINIYVLQKLINVINKGIFADVSQSGTDALEKCKNKKYNIIFVDINMPYMNGDEFVKLLRVFDKKVYVCCVSGQIDGFEEYLSNGFNKCFSKPIDIRELRYFLESFEF